MKDVKRYDRDYLLGMLPNLNLVDLQAVHTMATNLLGAHTEAISGPADVMPAALFDALQAICAGYGAWSTVALTKNGKLLIKTAPFLAKFFNRHFAGWDENRVLEQAFMRMVFELLSDDLKTRGLQPSFGIMVVNLSRVPDVINNAYPNYLSNGMGPMVLKALRPSLVG